MSRPRVLVAAMAGSRGGPRTYAVEIARRLATEVPELEVHWAAERSVAEVAGAGIRRHVLHLAHPVLRPLWDQLSLPALVARERIELVHHTKNALPALGGEKKVVTVHDLAHVRRPETFTRAARLFLEAVTRHAVRVADRIVTVSESTRRDLMDVYALAADRIRVVPNGVSARFLSVRASEVGEARRALGLPSSCVLFAGTIQPRKNPILALDAWRALPRPLRRRHPLVFVGRLGWMHEPFLDRLRVVARDEPVLLKTGVPDRFMPAVYAGATVFVSPSSYEGFGLTVLEAMAAGTPVIGGDTSSVPEVVGDAGVLVDPSDREALTSALRGLLEDPERRRELARAGRERAGRFTWERTAAETAAVYRELIATASR